jgi:transcriptional regulator with XRE-family HTH domain
MEAVSSEHPLKEWRNARGLTQEAAAEFLGLNTPTLSRYETGKRVPTLNRAAQLSEKTGIAINKFVKVEGAGEC